MKFTIMLFFDIIVNFIIQNLKSKQDFLKRIYKLSKTNIFFSGFEGTGGEKTKYFAPKPYLTCALCGNWKTAWKNLFQKHIITIHKDNTCCQTFEYTFDHIFENHAKYDCVICEEKNILFSKYEDLKDHMKSEHEKGYDCVGCQLFFPSKSELASHKETKHNHYKLLKITKGEEKHDCNICQAEYKSLAGLKHHISTVHENKGKFFIMSTEFDKNISD